MHGQRPSQRLQKHKIGIFRDAVKAIVRLQLVGFSDMLGFLLQHESEKFVGLSENYKR